MTTIAYVPAIGSLLQGMDYDMSVSLSVAHRNEMTRHPIEDPTRSFIYDHNREEPVSMSLSLQVSTDPLFSTGTQLTTGVDRISKFKDKILAMRAAQSVGTSAYFDVYTGIRVYHNMGIESLTFDRDEDEPNVLKVDLELVEFRFARPPRSESKTHEFDASDGPRSESNTLLVNDADRPIVEATRIRNAPRYISPTRQINDVLRASISKLSPVYHADLGISMQGVTVAVGAEVNILALDSVPSQEYTVRLDSKDHSLRFDYNQLADAWSFSAAMDGEDCPVVGGRFMRPGFNLLAGIASEQMLIPLDRPGIEISRLDGYARFTRPLSDGVTATMLAIGTPAAFNGLFRQRSSIAC